MKWHESEGLECSGVIPDSTSESIVKLMQIRFPSSSRVVDGKDIPQKNSDHCQANVCYSGKVAVDGDEAWRLVAYGGDGASTLSKIWEQVGEQQRDGSFWKEAAMQPREQWE